MNVSMTASEKEGLNIFQGWDCHVAQDAPCNDIFLFVVTYHSLLVTVFTEGNMLN